MERNIRKIITVTGFLGLINGLQRFLLPIALVSYGWSLASYGIVYFVRALGMALPLLLGGVFTDYKGRRVTVTVSFASYGIGSLVFAFVISGTALWPLVIAQMLTTVSLGITRMGLSIQMADETREGQDRTNSLGLAAGIGSFMGFIAPLLMGITLDQFNISLLTLDQYQVGFIFLSILGFSGVIISSILPQTDADFIKANRETKILEISSEEKKMQAAFGIEEAIIGLTSGMIVPYIDFYILTQFIPTNTQWGILFGLGNIAIAIGAILGGRYSENFGKIRTIMVLYAFVPFLAAGIAFGNNYAAVGLFYVLRIGTANLIKPVWESWYFSQTTDTARGRLLSFIQLNRRVARAIGILSGPFVFGISGPIIFPIACVFYPIAMSIPALTQSKLPQVSKISNKMLVLSD